MLELWTLFAMTLNVDFKQIGEILKLSLSLKKCVGDSYGGSGESATPTMTIKLLRKMRQVAVPVAMVTSCPGCLFGSRRIEVWAENHLYILKINSEIEFMHQWLGEKQGLKCILQLCIRCTVNSNAVHSK